MFVSTCLLDLEKPGLITHGETPAAELVLSEPDAGGVSAGYPCVKL